jgi:hypothetical protein
MTHFNDPYDPDSDSRTPEQIFNADEWDQRAPPAAPSVPVSYGAAVLPIPLPAVVEHDTACRKCAYNLRGLPGNEQCPECGSPIELSLRGNLLRNCDPGWLGTLQWGARLIVLGACMLICATVVQVVLMYARTNVTSVQRADLRAIFLAIQAAFAVGYVVGLVGSWLVTQPDPSGTGEDLYGTARKFTRIATTIGAIGLLVRMSLALDLYTPDLLSYVQVALAIVALAVALGWAAQLRYIQFIALRIPDSHLSRRARFLSVGLTVTWTIVMLISFAIQFAVRSRQRGPMTAYGCVIAVAGIPCGIFYIMNVAMMNRLAGHLGQLRDLAREAWSGQS